VSYVQSSEGVSRWFTPWLVIPVLRSCQSPIRTWLVSSTHLHTYSKLSGHVTICCVFQCMPGKLLVPVPFPDQFDVERQDLLGRISLCQASATECHSLRCEVQKRTVEVRELQQALSAAHMHLFEERDRLLQLQAENDELRHHDMENRQRLEQLTALADPVNQAITFSRDQGPSTGIVYPQKGGKDMQRKGKVFIVLLQS